MITTYEILQIFYNNPDSTCLIDGKTLKHILLEKQGKIISKGRLWKIENIKVGPDVYKIWLDRTWLEST